MAGIILFINYPIKIGDSITILEKDNANNITGEIKDIHAFFVALRTPEKKTDYSAKFYILQNNIIRTIFLKSKKMDLALLYSYIRQK